MPGISSVHCINERPVNDSAKLRGVWQTIVEKRFSSEPIRRVSGAKVLWADYGRIARDIPGLSRASAPQIERWLIKRTAVISETQSEQSKVNDHVASTRLARRAFRPPHYGRSLIVEVGADEPSAEPVARQSSAGIFVDVKGCGVGNRKKPRLVMDANGLLSLPHAFRELITQGLIEGLFEKLGIAISGVPVYAVIDLGFWATFYGGYRLPAALMVRRAHLRRWNRELPAKRSVEHRIKLQIEVLLRCFGLTSCTSATKLCLRRGNDGHLSYKYGETEEFKDLPRTCAVDDLSFDDRGLAEFDCVNVQLTSEFGGEPLYAQLVDFGQYQPLETPARPLATLVSDRFLNWGGMIYPHEWPDRAPMKTRINPTFFQPAHPGNGIGEWVHLQAEETLSQLACFGLKTAYLSHKGELAGPDVSTAIDGFLAAALA